MHNSHMHFGRTQTVNEPQKCTQSERGRKRQKERVRKRERWRLKEGRERVDGEKEAAN